MEGSVLSFLKAEFKVSDTGSAHWASSSTFAYILFTIITGEVQLSLEWGLLPFRSYAPWN